MRFITYNGKQYLENEPLIGADNRGLKYGDGLFETMKYKNGQVLMLEQHLSRLWKGLQLLKFEVPSFFTAAYLQEQITALLAANDQNCARVRLSVIRGNGGLAGNSSLNYIIQSWPLDEHTGKLNREGLKICIYRDAKKTIDHFSNLKHNNYLTYSMGALFAKEQQCNDAIILNSANRVCDTTIANVFIIKDQTVITCPLEEGCIAGTMRALIIAQLTEASIPVEEKAITVEELLNADEVFTTNSIFNMRWVAALEGSKYENAVIKKIYQLLLQTNPMDFC